MASGSPPKRGLAILLYPGQPSAAALAAALAEIASLGATHVALVVTWSQRDVASVRVARGDRTASDAQIRRAIRAAHTAGLGVLLFPIIAVAKTSAGEWRGTLQPADVDKWWSSYEELVLHCAGIAAAEGAEALSIGSELGTTEGWRYRWYHLISRVERVYDGTLIYSANWDHFEGVSFWRRLDSIGVTGYFELTDDRNASEAELRRGWIKPRAALRELAAKRKKPLWLTEVGYPSRDGAALHPWDYTSATGTGDLDLEEQRRCYAALRDTWAAVPELDALFIWNWHGTGGRRDRDYTPRGKPAEKVLRGWWTGSR